MGLYRAHDTRNLWIAWLSLAALAAYSIVVTTHLIAVANAPAPFLQDIKGDPRLELEVYFDSKQNLVEAILPLFFLYATLLIYLLGVIIYSRWLSYHRSIGESDVQQAWPTENQPQRDLALNAGETLTLTQTRSRGERNLQLLRIVPILLMPVSGIGPLFLLLPSPWYSVSMVGLSTWFSLMGPLDWLSLTIPLAIWGVWIPGVILLWRGWRRELRADDRGLSYEEDWKRQFIAWDDIQLFLLRGGADSGDITHKGFLIWGTTARIEFSILAPDENQPYTHFNFAPYTLAGGYEVYERDAQRLLATIAARSGQPLTYWNDEKKSDSSPATERRLSVAPAELQPSEAAVAAARANAKPDFTLAPTVRLWSVLRLALMFFVVIVAMLAGVFILLPNPLMQPASLFGGDPMVIAAYIMVGVFSVGFSLMCGYAFRVQRIAAISVSEYSLHHNRSLVNIPWQDVRSWEVTLPPSGSKRPLRYTVRSNAGKISWVEPEGAKLAGRVEGDRVAAFRARAEALHALIVARTGLPLRIGSVE